MMEPIYSVVTMISALTQAALPYSSISDGIRQVGRVRQIDDFAVGLIYLVNNARGRSHQIQVVFPLQTLLDDFQMKQAQETAAETKAQRNGGLRLELEGKRRLTAASPERPADPGTWLRPPDTGRSTP